METFHHSFVATDLSLLGLYSIPQKNGNELLPVLGFFGSFNKFIGSGYGVSNLGQTSGGSQAAQIPMIENSPSAIYFGIATGVNYKMKILNFPVELVGMLYLSPSDMFDVTFNYVGNIEQTSYKGKYHYLNLGINVPIMRKTKID